MNSLLLQVGPEKPQSVWAVQGFGGTNCGIPERVGLEGTLKLIPKGKKTCVLFKKLRGELFRKIHLILTTSPLICQE